MMSTRSKWPITFFLRGKLSKKQRSAMELHAGIGANVLTGSSSEVRQMGEEIALSRMYGGMAADIPIGSPNCFLISAATVFRLG